MQSAAFEEGDEGFEAGFAVVAKSWNGSVFVLRAVGDFVEKCGQCPRPGIANDRKKCGLFQACTVLFGLGHFNQAFACAHGTSFGLLVVVLMAAWASDGFIQVKNDGRIAAFSDSIESNVVFWVKHDAIEIVAFDL